MFVHVWIFLERVYGDSKLGVMVLVSNDGFLTALTKLFQSSKSSGTIWITMKKCIK